MAVVRTFAYVRPPARGDGVKFTSVRIEEAEDNDGTPGDDWLELETQALALEPVTRTAAEPVRRRITVEGTRDVAWYRLGWIAGSGAVAYSDAFLCRPAPIVADVARLLRARTRDDFGNETGMFTADTRPTAREVEQMLVVGMTDVNGRLAPWIPDNFLHVRNQIVALRAAALIEGSFFPEEDGDDNAPPSSRYIAMAEAELAALGRTLNPPRLV